MLAPRMQLHLTRPNDESHIREKAYTTILRLSPPLRPRFDHL